MPHFYSLTIQPATAVTCAVWGNFSAPRVHEIIVARGKVLELLRPDETTGKMQSVLSQEVFGLIRCMTPFRLYGAKQDYLVVGSDSGKIVLLEYNAARNSFDKVRQETFGKTGCRRIVPGQYISADPQGRAIMVSAVEKQKFVYVMGRDNQLITISSPHEGHRAHTIVFDTCALDMGLDSPQFACLEVNYQQAEAGKAEKVLTVYEMEVGSDTFKRATASAVDMSAHALIPVPGGMDGPGGVIVCCENYLVYRKEDQEDLVCAMPRRLEMPQEKGLMVVAHATHRAKDFFFFLIQSEYGDLYKVSLQHETTRVTELRVKYFDTIPVAVSLCLLKTGWLFAASEFGNHALYYFEGIGADTTDPEARSSQGADAILPFRPRPLRNLSVKDDMPSLCPLVDMRVMDATGEGQNQIYALCGRGARSSLRVLRHGLSVSSIADAALPGQPQAVFSVKGSVNAEFDLYIILSFTDVTMVLKVDDGVEEVADSGFHLELPTLHAQIMRDDSYIQVHTEGIRHFRPKRPAAQWKSGGRKVVCATANESHVAIAVAGGELLLFEMDDAHAVNEQAKRPSKNGVEITSLSIQTVPAGRLRASFLAVASADNVVRILSLDQQRPLKQLTETGLKAPCESLCILDMGGSDSSMLSLCIGLTNGVLERCALDPVTGTLSDHRMRFLGRAPVKLQRVNVQGQQAVLALTDKPWLCYSLHGKYQCTALRSDKVECATSFASDECPEGFVGITSAGAGAEAAGEGGALRIFSCDRIGESFHQEVMPLSYTPRRMVPLFGMEGHTMVLNEKGKKMLAIIEAEHNSYTEEIKNEVNQELKRTKLPSFNETGEEVEGEEEEDVEESQVGSFKAGEGRWGSCLRVVDPELLTTVCKVNFDPDEAATSLTLCLFSDEQGMLRPHLVVGTAYQMYLKPRQAAQSYLKVFAYDDQFQLRLRHVTRVDGIPQALFPLESTGRLLASCGSTLRVYEMGLRQLLKKCEYKNIPTAVNWIQVKGNRIFVSDMRESIHVLQLRKHDTHEALYVLADETTPRWVTCATLLDYHTIAGCDKFDNFFVLRLPADTVDEEGGDFTGLRMKADTAYITGQCKKLDQVCHFHLGDTGMALQRAQLLPGNPETLLYATLMGAICTMVPLAHKDDVDFFQHLELHLRGEKPPLCGRDHMMFRSFYSPCQGVVDGDLCEQFASLSIDKQKQVALEMDKTPTEIIKRLEDMRNAIL